jgi:hypothetical protein
MMPINTILTGMVPQADAMLTVGGGAIAVLAVLVVLALAAVFGVARELRRADGTVRTTATYPARGLAATQAIAA